jgi:uncharacterized protein
MVATPDARIATFLVKIASRCNLACDYCYMYEHADQSWRGQPKLMSEGHRRLLARRIADYCEANRLERILIIFHGGEPLLAGVGRIVETLAWVRSSVPPGTRVDASVQTNGVLLTDEALELFEREHVSVSVSIDGPQVTHDRHRLNHRGQSTFRETLASVERLKRHPTTYAGLIAVIDPSTDPNDLFEFFSGLAPPRLDFLLPDANHLAPPPGRDGEVDIYAQWLTCAFDLWFDRYPELRVRTFEALLDAIAGLPAETDAFGLGDVSLLTIETDGTYHDLDVLKVTAPGGTATGLGLEDATIAEAASSPRIEAHRRRLRREGLSAECRACLVVDICGGGSVPHRYAADGFDHPTVYCREMKSLIQHARRRVGEALGNAVEDPAGRDEPLRVADAELARFDHPIEGRPFLDELRRDWKERSLINLTKALDSVVGRQSELAGRVAELRGLGAETIGELAVQPSVVLWASVTEQSARGLIPRALDGRAIPDDPGYIETLLSWGVAGPPLTPRVHRNDPWLRHPFGDRINFETPESAGLVMPLFDRAWDIIGRWNPGLLDEMKLLSPEVQFIRDPSAHPDKAVSFSDNSVPGCLYVSVRRGGGWIGPYDLADSLIHEHRHQKLYVLQAYVPLLVADVPLVPSPWREELRPPSGLLHAVFVFVGLLDFWRHVAEQGEPEVQEYARGEVGVIKGRLKDAFPTLFETALTSTGRRLVNALSARVQALRIEPMKS